MRAIPARSALLLLTLVSFTPPALADWPPAGVVIATPLPEIAGFMHPGEMVLLAAPDGSVVALGSGITSMDQYWGSLTLPAPARQPDPSPAATSDAARPLTAARPRLRGIAYLR